MEKVTTSVEALDEGYLFGTGDAFATLLGHFGQVTNLISFMVSLLGFSYLIDRIGVKLTLLIFPITLFLGVLTVHLVPSLWVSFIFVSILKAMIFSLQEPTKVIIDMNILIFSTPPYTHPHTHRHTPPHMYLFPCLPTNHCSYFLLSGAAIHAHQ